MNIELSQHERNLLTQLVDSALREIGSEIRRTMTYDYKDELKEQRKTLRCLHNRLVEDRPRVQISEV